MRTSVDMCRRNEQNNTLYQVKVDVGVKHREELSHVIGVCLPSQSASETHNQEKSPQTFAHPVLSAMFDNHAILLFWL